MDEPLHPKLTWDSCLFIGTYDGVDVYQGSVYYRAVWRDGSGGLFEMSFHPAISFQFEWNPHEQRAANAVQTAIHMQICKL